MTVESASDRLEMLSDFGVDAVFTPDSGSPSTVKVIFDNQYQGSDVGADADVAAQLPRCLGREEDIGSAVEGDQITINSVDYFIRVPMPDGTGMVELVLEEAE